MHPYCTISSTGMSWRLGFLANNAPTNTKYVSGLQFVPISRLRCSGTSKIFEKVVLLHLFFVQYVFANFQQI